MHIIRFRYGLPVLVFVLFFSCKKTTVEGPAGPPGPNGTDGASTVAGTVYGRVALFDSLGKAQPDNSGATILFENTNSPVSFNSAADGFFTSPILSSGIYNISFSKPGYGTMRLVHFNHTGGPNSSQTGLIEMGQRLSSWFDIKNLEVDTGNHYMNMIITLAHPQTIPYSWGILYFSHAPGVGNGSNDFAFRSVFYQLTDSTMICEDFSYDLTAYSNQFNSTDYVYISVALDNPKLFTYTDSARNAVYPAAGKLSNEVKVFNNLKNY